MAIALFAASALFAIHEEEVAMKLINSKSGFVLVEFKNGAPLFHDRFLEAEMKDRGIAIPLNRRAEYKDKESIYPGDSQFQKAFTEIYVPLVLASNRYQWLN